MTITQCQDEMQQQTCPRNPAKARRVFACQGPVSIPSALELRMDLDLFLSVAVHVAAALGLC